MAFKSLGERLGFVSAGDVRRARERKIREEAEKRGREAESRKAEARELEAARRMLRDGIPLEKVKEYQNLSDELVAKL